ncbi:MAG: bifunctional diaminohydroxyphosphoribosylaminopyrimidine deaminase/5-amino-6-(5-phosphoribosylamino)uracil reductase RibD [Bacteroidetes bacterium]|nr:bifunctional diaminohydroxyphosphoribosylaminopyrimidine deaminase/5-amino-6-(5-phosphoribosylamino)uracil reductase RibD [Bacteroidota bacterium]
MERCIHLARLGVGSVSPNPLVGAVLVKDGVKIGEGYHERFGENHAEINAIHNALKGKRSLAGSTLYVNLEPCSHYGKTPPCAEAIIRHGITRVVVGCKDPNPIVAGRGIALLRKNKITVKTGVLSKEVIRLNEFFIKYILTGIPFITLKAAQTADGYIARINGSSKWITNQLSRRYVHQLRNEYDAVLVGAGTVIQDNPELTVRAVPGRNPVRIILDGRCSVPLNRKIFDDQAKTIIYTTAHAAARESAKILALQKRGIIVVPVRSKSDRLDIRAIVSDLGKRGISSLLIEGGPGIYSAFLDARTADALFLFTAQKKFSSGIKTFGKISVSFRKKLVSERYFRSDRLQNFRITFP